MAPEIVIDDKTGLQRILTERFVADAGSAIAAQGRFSIVLPGGSVAEAFFPQLAEAPIDWSKVDFFWGDERAVAADDPDSNYRLAKSLWLDRIPVQPSQIHRMHGERRDLDDAAASYADDLHSHFRGRPRFDFVLLGVGPEGHVCSLFPGHAALHDVRLVVALHDSPKPPPQRITLTLAALKGAVTLCVAAFGKEKANTIAEAVKDSGSSLPVALTARDAVRSIFLLDAAAASSL